MTQFPSLFQNGIGEQNQNNLQPQPMSTQSYDNQTLQPKLPPGPFSQQASNFMQQQQQQQRQQHPSGPNFMQQQQPIGQQASMGVFQANPYPFYNNWQTGNPMIGNSGSSNCSSLPQNILEQIRACSQCASPIFILPSSPGNPSPMSPCQPILSPACIPYPMPMPIYPQYISKQSDRECKCSNPNSANGNQPRNNEVGWARDLSNFRSHNADEPHQCKETNDGTICARKNCPASIQLQAMVSQLLGVQGVVACAVTRILLRQISSSGIPESAEEILRQASRCIRQMSQDQLFRESRACQQVHSLLGLFLASQSTLPRVIPVLTCAQLKSNALKALVEGLLSAKLTEEQGNYAGTAEAPEPLDALLLELRSDEELRQLLCQLRERECEERVNVSFAASGAQRLVAESRLANAQRKIQQLEREIQRRRDMKLGSSSKKYGSMDYCVVEAPLQCNSAPATLPPRRHDSPDPFKAARLSFSPKRLLLRPHVGSPETTYRSSKPEEDSPFCMRTTAESSEEVSGDQSKPSTATKEDESKSKEEQGCTESEDGREEDEKKDETCDDGNKEDATECGTENNYYTSDCEELDDGKKDN